MRDVVLGVLIAALGLAFTFVYAGTITPKHVRETTGPQPTLSSTNEAGSNKKETR